MAPLGLSLGIALVMVTGCSPSKRSTVSFGNRQGSIQLDKLVAENPGWVGIEQYDQAIARLRVVPNQSMRIVGVSADLGTLPEIAAVVPTVPVHEIAEERTRLLGQEKTQITRLASRLALARQSQVDRKMDDWERSADVTYRRTADLALTSYDHQFNQIYAENALARVNLLLQIDAIKKLILHWSLSTPPAPILNTLQQELVDKQVALTALEAQRGAQVANARSQRDKALQSALETRSATVSAQAADEQRSLEALDAKKVEAERSRLSTQMASLLSESGSFKGVSVPSAGSLGQVTMPSDLGTPSVTASRAKLQVAIAQLEAEREKWRIYLYADTRAAALDAASRQHWAVTFGRAQPGETDLTPQMAALLKAQVWTN